MQIHSPVGYKSLPYWHGCSAYLKNDDEEEDAAGNVHLEACEDHGHGAQLTHQIYHHEQRGQNPATHNIDIKIKIRQLHFIKPRMIPRILVQIGCLNIDSRTLMYVNPSKGGKKKPQRTLQSRAVDPDPHSFSLLDPDPDPHSICGF